MVNLSVQVDYTDDGFGVTTFFEYLPYRPYTKVACRRFSVL